MSDLDRLKDGSYRPEYGAHNQSRSESAHLRRLDGFLDKQEQGMQPSRAEGRAFERFLSEQLREAQPSYRNMKEPVPVSRTAGGEVSPREMGKVRVMDKFRPPIRLQHDTDCCNGPGGGGGGSVNPPSDASSSSKDSSDSSMSTSSSTPSSSISTPSSSTPDSSSSTPDNSSSISISHSDGSDGSDPDEPSGPSHSSSGGTGSYCQCSITAFASEPCTDCTNPFPGQDMGSITIYASVSINCSGGCCTNGTGVLTIGGQSFPFSGFDFGTSATLPCICNGGSIEVSVTWTCSIGDCAGKKASCNCQIPVNASMSC